VTPLLKTIFTLTLKRCVVSGGSGVAARLALRCGLRPRGHSAAFHCMPSSCHYAAGSTHGVNMATRHRARCVVLPSGVSVRHLVRFSALSISIFCWFAVCGLPFVVRLFMTGGSASHCTAGTNAPRIARFCGSRLYSCAGVYRYCFASSMPLRVQPPAAAYNAGLFTRAAPRLLLRNSSLHSYKLYSRNATWTVRCFAGVSLHRGSLYPLYYGSGLVCCWTTFVGLWCWQHTRCTYGAVR